MARNRSRGEVLAWMLAVTACSYFARLSISIAGPDILREFRFSEAQLGTIFGASAIAYAVCQVPAGWISDRFGPRRTLTHASVGMAFAIAVAGLTTAAGAFLTLVGARLLFGTFAAAVFPASGVLTKRWFRREQYGRVQGVILAAAGIGAMLAPLVVGAVIAMQGWRASFLWGSVVTLTLGLFWHWRVRDGAPLPQTLWKGAETKPLVADPSLILLTLSYTIVGVYCAFFENWMFYYLREVRHYSSGESAWSTAAVQGGMTLGVGLGGWMTDRFRNLRSRSIWMVGIQGAAATFLVVACFAPEGLVVVVLLCLANMIVSLTDACFAATAIQAGGHRPATYFGVMNAGWALGLAVGSALIPGIASAIGWNPALYAVALLLVGGASLWLAMPALASGDTTITVRRPIA